MVPCSTMSSVSPPSSCFCRNFSAVAAQTVLLRNHWLQIVLLGRAWFVSVWADSLSLLAIHGKGRIQHLPLQHCNSAGSLMVGCNKTKSADAEKQCFAATARLWEGHLINIVAPVAWRQVVQFAGRRLKSLCVSQKQSLFNFFSHVWCERNLRHLNCY